VGVILLLWVGKCKLDVSGGVGWELWREGPGLKPLYLLDFRRAKALRSHRRAKSKADPYGMTNKKCKGNDNSKGNCNDNSKSNCNDKYRDSSLRSE
jgi:hypothetical protein